ncbi:MAG: hypothetical protein HOP07_02305 [Bacteriovoracaceae bacterium]|nr:hypothetical protein [Bacteriovoracaceae bacterium]
MKMVVGFLILTLIGISDVHAQSSSYGFTNPTLSSSGTGLSATSRLGISIGSQSEPGISRIPMQSYSSVSGSIDCPQTTYSLTEPIQDMTEFGQSFSRFTSCKREPLLIQKFLKSRFNNTNCTRALACKRSLTDPLNADKFEAVDDKLNILIAKDHAKNLIDRNLSQLERLEILKKYAAKEFNLKVNSKCSAPLSLDKKSDSCMPDLVGEGFQRHQELCEKGSACFKNQMNGSGTKSYADFKTEFIKENPEDKSSSYLMLKFLESKVDQKSLVTFAKVPQQINEAANLFSSESFKKLGEEEKMKEFFKHFPPDGAGLFGDPVLGFDFNSNDFKKLKKSTAFNDLMKILNKKSLDKTAFISEFNNFRKKRAEYHLSKGEVCNSALSLNTICNETTKISKGELLNLDSDTANTLASEMSGDYSDLADFSVIFGVGFGQNELETLADANRCRAFGLAEFSSVSLADLQSPIDTSFMGLGNISGYGSGGSVSTYYGLGNSSSSIRLGSSVESSGLDKSPETINEPYGLKEPVVGIGNSANSNDHLDESEAESSNNSISNFSPQATGANQYFPEPFNSSGQNFNAGNFGSGIVDDESDDEKLKKAVAANSQFDGVAAKATTADDRVSELLKKLAVAEAEVTRVKDEAKTAEEARLQKEKLAADQAVITDLKKQISDLQKKPADKKVIVAAAEPAAKVIQSPVTHLGADSASFARGDIAFPNKKAVSNFDSGEGAIEARSPISVGATNAARNQGSGAILTSVNNSDGSKTTTLPSGDVVLEFFGVAPDKIEQLLSERFKDPEVKSLLIEEDGVIKEVVKVFDENGKDVFKRIIRGRRDDSKFAGVKSNRAPASNALSPADLKRAQDKLMRDRAEYKKLKAITDKAFEKK